MMDRDTIERLVLSSQQLWRYVEAGEASAERAKRFPEFHICRMSDEATALYRATAEQIDKLTARFPQFHPAPPETAGPSNMELAS